MQLTETMTLSQNYYFNTASFLSVLISLSSFHPSPLYSKKVVLVNIDIVLIEKY